MSEMVKCPLCGKEIGKVIQDGAMASPLGPIGFYRHENDYRKASHVYWQGGRREKSGTLCRKCAKQKYPEGQYYRVAFWYHAKKMYTCAENGDKYSTRAKADEVAKRQSDKTGSPYWVETFKI